MKKHTETKLNFSLLKTSELVFNSAPLWWCPKSSRSVQKHRLTDCVSLQREPRHEDSDPPEHGKASILHYNLSLSVSHINEVKSGPELQRSGCSLYLRLSPSVCV